MSEPTTAGAPNGATPSASPVTPSATPAPAVLIDPTTGHLSEHAVVWKKKSNFLGIPYQVTVTHGDVLRLEEDIEPGSQYLPVEQLVADLATYAAHAEWGPVASTAAEIITAGVAIGDPQFSAAANSAVQLITALAEHNTAGVESALLALGGEVLTLIPEIKVVVAKL